MIHTYSAIIATMLATIMYSIVLTSCWVLVETLWRCLGRFCSKMLAIFTWMSPSIAAAMARLLGAVRLVG